MSGNSFYEWLNSILGSRDPALSPPAGLSPAEDLLAQRLQMEMRRCHRDFMVYIQAFQGMEKFYDMSIRALSAFIKVGKLTEEATNIELLCRNALEIFSQELEFENCSIMLRDQDEEYLTLIAGRGRGDRYFGGRKAEVLKRIKIGEGVAGMAFQTGEHIFIPDVRADARFKEISGTVEISSLLSIPIRNDEGLIGVLNFSHPHMEAFDRNTISIMLLLSSYIGQMITITRLHNKIAKWNEILRTLAVEKERLALVLSSIGDGVVTVDTDEKVILLNHIAEQLTGWTQDDAIGRPLSDLFRLRNRQTGDSLPNPASWVIRTCQMINMPRPVTLEARDGTEKLVTLSGTPVCNRNGGLIGAVVIFRDITAKQKLEEEIIREQKLESVGILAGGIAHDFNNLLTGILGNIGLAKMYLSPGNDRTLERLDEAERASVRAKALTQQLLTFSKGGEPVKTVIPACSLITEATVFALRGSNVRSEFSFPDESLCIEVDEGQMGQVIHNIVLNAQQAMPDGGTVRIGCDLVTISADDYLPLAEGPYVCISIQDEGPGISDDILNEIFDPYFTTKTTGSGLGLSTCYSIIRKHDGHIAVKSGPGAGATFRIYLPAATRASVPQREGEEEINSSLGCRVLVTDDEEIVRSIAGEMLGYFGCEVEYAADGVEAVGKYREAIVAGRPYDLVMLDLTIPGGMGGREAIGLLREIDPAIKAIVVSGYSNDPVMSQYQSFGFKGVVTKPYRMIDLNREVRRVLSGK